MFAVKSKTERSTFVRQVNYESLASFDCHSVLRWPLGGDRVSCFFMLKPPLLLNGPI